MTGENRPPLQAVFPGYSAGALAGNRKKKRREGQCSIATLYSRLGPATGPKIVCCFVLLFIRTLRTPTSLNFKTIYLLIFLSLDGIRLVCSCMRHGMAIMGNITFCQGAKKRQDHKHEKRK